MPKDDIQGLFQYLLETKTIALFTGVAANFLMTTLKVLEQFMDREQQQPQSQQLLLPQQC